MAANPQTTALVVAKPAAVQAAIIEKREAIESLLEGTPLTYQRFLQISLLEINKNPAIQECELLSVIGALVEASRLGLEVGGTRQECALVPVWNGRLKRKECQLRPMFRGKEELARRSGLVKMFFRGVVCEKDDYEFFPQAIPRHKKAAPRRAERGPVQYAWASAVFFDGSVQSIEIDLDRIDRARRASQSGDSGPWITDEFAMIEKTAIHDLCKHLAQSPLKAADRPAAFALARMADLEAQAEDGEPQNLGGVLNAQFEDGHLGPTIEVQRSDGSTVNTETGEVTPAPAWKMTDEKRQVIFTTMRGHGIPSQHLLARMRGVGMPEDTALLTAEQYQQVFVLIGEIVAETKGGATEAKGGVTDQAKFPF